MVTELYDSVDPVLKEAAANAAGTNAGLLPSGGAEGEQDNGDIVPNAGSQ